MSSYDQETSKLTSEIDSFTGILKQRVLHMRDSIERDSEIITTAMTLTEENQARVHTDTKSIDDRTRTSRRGLFADIFLMLSVAAVIAVMVILMKLFPKPRR
ncbi:hypothetical protein GEMRC1_012293 [Eukaryota sp. GEM-RC1]